MAALIVTDELMFYNIFHIVEIELTDSLLAAAVSSSIQSAANNYCSVAVTATFYFKHLFSHIEVALGGGGGEQVA